MQKKTWLVGLAVIVGILAVVFFQNKAPHAASVYENLERTQQLHRKDLDGTYLLVHFWAKWCEPCADEIPHVVEFARQAQFHKPLKILAISLDPTLEDSKSILPNHGEGLPVDFILVSDPEHKIAEGMGSYQYPETYFIGPKGDILEKWVGPQKWNKPEVLEFFKQKLI